MLQRISSRALAGDPLLFAACGSSSTAEHATRHGGRTSGIVRGASFSPTAAFDPNPKTVGLADGGGVRWVNGDNTTHQMMSDNRRLPDLGPHPAGEDVQRSR
jgi:hypothetical protein